jgi:hypothetical protein
MDGDGTGRDQRAQLRAVLRAPQAAVPSRSSLVNLEQRGDLGLTSTTTERGAGQATSSCRAAPSSDFS